MLSREELQEFLVAFDGSIEIHDITDEIMDSIAERMVADKVTILDATIQELEEFEILEPGEYTDFIEAWAEFFDEDD